MFIIIIIGLTQKNYEKYKEIPNLFINCNKTNEIFDSTPLIKHHIQYDCDEFEIKQTLFLNKQIAKLAAEKVIEDINNTKTIKCSNNKKIHIYVDENPFLLVLEKNGSVTQNQQNILIQDYSITTIITTSNQEKISKYSNCQENLYK